MQIFDKQRGRGTQGFGVYDGQEDNLVHASKEESILKWLTKYDSNMLLFHHRFPTSTVNVKRAAHPFATKDFFGDTEYILVHNGVMRNENDRYDEHVKLGIQYQSLLEDGSFNDSEALLWDLALHLEGDLKEFESIGRLAFVCIKREKGQITKLYFGRNGSPLNMYRDKNGIALSSEGPGEPINTHKLYTWHYKSKRLTTKDMRFPEFLPYRGGAYEYHPQPSTTPALPAYSGFKANADSSYEGNFDNYEDDWATGWSREVHGFHPNKNERRLSSAPAWLGDTLRNKFGRFFEDANNSVIVSGYDSDQTYAEQLVNMGGTLPSEEAVHGNILTYLTKNEGHFDSTYWNLEIDYQQALDDYDDLDSLYFRVLLENSIRLIQDDPEYKDNKSVSSVGGALWQQQKLAG